MVRWFLKLIGRAEARDYVVVDLDTGEWFGPYSEAAAQIAAAQMEEDGRHAMVFRRKRLRGR